MPSPEIRFALNGKIFRSSDRARRAKKRDFRHRAAILEHAQGERSAFFGRVPFLGERAPSVLLAVIRKAEYVPFSVFSPVSSLCGLCVELPLLQHRLP
jgi:hypothetical protein